MLVYLLLFSEIQCFLDFSFGFPDLHSNCGLLKTVQLWTNVLILLADYTMPVAIGAENQTSKVIRLLHWSFTVVLFNCLVICFLILVNSTYRKI